MPTATDILNSATSANEAKHKLKSTTQVKLKTFYGGELIKDITTLNLTMAPSPTSSQKKASFRLNPSCPAPHLLTSTSLTSTSTTTTTERIEFIGACVKLEKSNLSQVSSNQLRSQQFRVNFSDVPETFEYPSYECVLKEMGIDPTEDSDYQMVPDFEKDGEIGTFADFLPGGGSSMSSECDSSANVYYDNQAVGFYGEADNAEFMSATKFTKGQLIYSILFYSTEFSLIILIIFCFVFVSHYIILSEAQNQLNNILFIFTLFLKGSFTNFKPSWQTMHYELGSVDNFEILQPINQNGTSPKSFSKSSSNREQSVSDSFITNDILPTKEEDLKRWSSDMDSNILF